ncbi:putative metalloprotease CJM1_0395 family protein [Azospirillum isscasi]|uniref:Metalloprotease CJM1_0395 family protein n=1 Tax=Azospirillum isscasi TaxID=3053926 RepID=A0ABU0WQ32_9PROT|nr:putative metalloprotease CJM1_0395 family protein [Azospirillum isscasi]MDQ2106348.1 putative metalloprotease CJM1_0395 family protein [Azospirillum isscasi]
MVAGVSSSGVHGLPVLRTGLPARDRKQDGAPSADQAQPTDQKETGQTAAGLPGKLTDDQQRQVQELKRIDASVRQHEAAHQAAGGPHAGGASFTFTRGPDGKNYATAGEVQVDVSAESDPEATARKMDTVKAAALAPSDPSAQDLRVAQQADAAKMQAQQEMRKGPGQGARSGDSRNGEDGVTGSDTAAPALAARGTAAYASAYGIGRRTGTAGIMV